MSAAEFLTTLRAEKVREAGAVSRARWRLLDPLVYRSPLLGDVIVPEGFETDFASVPRLPLAYLLTGDTAHASAVVHDYLVGVLTWGTAAEVFREAMRAEGVPGWRAWLMYWAVKLAKPASEE